MRRREQLKYQIEVIYAEISPEEDAVLRRRAIRYAMDCLLREDARRTEDLGKDRGEERECAP